MTALQIVLLALGGLLLLILLLLIFGRTRVSLDYKGGLLIRGFVLGIRVFHLTPKKKSGSPDLIDLTDCKNPESAVQKNWKRQKQELAKKRKKQEDLELKRIKKQIKKSKRHKDSSDLPLSFEETFTLVLHLVKRAYRITKGKFRLHIRALTIRVGSPDAATTALLYGSLSGLLAGVLDLLDTHMTPTSAEPGSIAIAPDFTAEKSTGEISLDLSVSLLQALLILAKGGISYTHEKKAAQEHAKTRLQKSTLENPSADAE